MVPFDLNLVFFTAKTEFKCAECRLISACRAAGFPDMAGMPDLSGLFRLAGINRDYSFEDFT
jgi:hypothetical protein